MSRLARIACMCVLALAVALVPATAWADGDATLTLKMKYESQGKTTLVSGVTATAYQVASLGDDDSHYTLTQPFASLGVDFDFGMDASTMASAAQKAAKIVADNKLTGKMATSGSDGLISFGALPKGVYLVTQTASTGDAAKYNDFAPFLINVPQITTEGITYNVVSLPKFTAKPETPKEPAKPLSKTGDSNNPLLWMTYTLVGGALVLTGSYIRRRMANARR